MSGFPFSGALDLWPMSESTADERERTLMGPLVFLFSVVRRFGNVYHFPRGGV